MGLLDDAIREHLELKRRRGADPAEISRLEHEAFGSARGAEPAAAAAAPPAPEPPPAAAEPDEDVHGATVAFDVEAELAAETADAPPPPSPPDPDPPHVPAVPSDEATGELDPADAIFADPDPDPSPQKDEDVLEETPEFLQETPEHDRLWFEQKPPRDFDFDG